MSLITILRDIDATDVVLVTAFEGWVDAAGVGSASAEHLAAGGEPVARFDSDALIDFRARRPELDIVEGMMKELRWPEISIRSVTIDGMPLLVMTGPEPDFRWHEFTREVITYARAVGVRKSISLGAIGSAVAHTKPTPLLATAADRRLLDDDEAVPDGLLRVPAAAVSALETAMTDAGIDARGIWAQVPHYVAGPFSQGVIAVLERLGGHLGISIPLGTLTQEADSQRRRIDELVAERPEAQSYIEELEQLTPTTDIPSGDEIAAEIERFLRRGPTDD